MVAIKTEYDRQWERFDYLINELDDIQERHYRESGMDSTFMRCVRAKSNLSGDTLSKAFNEKNVDLMRKMADYLRSEYLEILIDELIDSGQRILQLD